MFVSQYIAELLNDINYPHDKSEYCFVEVKEASIFNRYSDFELKIKRVKTSTALSLKMKIKYAYPTIHEVFEWLIKNHKLCISVSPTFSSSFENNEIKSYELSTNAKFEYAICRYDNIENYTFDVKQNLNNMINDISYDSYEEAANEAILKSILKIKDDEHQKTSD